MAPGHRPVCPQYSNRRASQDEYGEYYEEEGYYQEDAWADAWGGGDAAGAKNDQGYDQGYDESYYDASAAGAAGAAGAKYRESNYKINTQHHIK